MSMSKKTKVVIALIISFFLVCGAVGAALWSIHLSKGSLDSGSDLAYSSSAKESSSELSSIISSDLSSEKSSEPSSIPVDVAPPSSSSVILPPSSNPVTSTPPPVSSIGAPVQNGNETGKVCYLTFDDGPSDNTLKILDILTQYNAKATFFVVGTEKIAYTKNIVAQGSAVGLHANRHVYSECYANEAAFYSSMAAVGQKVQAQIGYVPNIIRFPGGSSNTVSRKHSRGIMTRLANDVGNKGYYYFDWNVSSGDATGVTQTPKAKIVSNVLNGARNKSTICVLMHDARGKTTTVQALPEIIVGLRNMGYTFEVLTEKSSGFHHGLNN